LPPQVSRVLLHDFENLLNSDLCTIAKFDTLNGPNGMQLFDSSNDIDDDIPDIENIEIPAPHISAEKPQIANANKLPPQNMDIQDEILNDPLDAVITNFSQNQTTQPNYSEVQDNILNSLQQKTDLPKNPDDVNINPQNVSLHPPIAPQSVPKQIDMPPDVKDMINSDSDSENDIENDKNTKNTVKTKKVTFQDP